MDDQSATLHPWVEERVIPGFVIQRVLGMGEHSVVYLARQRCLNRLVAVKTSIPNVQSPVHAERLRHEAAVAARLEHANVVRLHEAFERDGEFYCVYEYVDGESLRERLEQGPLAPNAAAGLLETVARAVHFVHEQGITHCDLKPENILLTRDGTPRITDFGVAGIGSQSIDSTAESVVGTPRYMAPEQIERSGVPLGPSVDIHALGIILYEMLTGRPPYLASTVADTLDQICLHTPLKPGRLQPHLPADIETICLKCLYKNPASRYLSAMDLADDLSRFRRHEPIRARHIGLLEKGLLWRRRHPAVAGLVAIVCLAALISLALLGQQYRATVTALQRAGNARQSQTDELMETLRTADESSFAFVQETLTLYWVSLQPRIHRAMLENNISEEERTRYELALVAEQPQLIDSLRERAWSAEPQEFELIVTTLERQKNVWDSEIWQAHVDAIREATGASDVPSEQSFRAVVMLAFHRIPLEGISVDLKATAAGLLRKNALNLPTWKRLLAPIGSQLVDSLAEVLDDGSWTPEQRHLAASILADYAANDPKRLAKLILDAVPADFEVLFEPLQKFREATAEQMQRQLVEQDVPENWNEREAHWKIQANAALVLMKLGETDPVWPLFAHSPDPTLRSRLIHRCATSGLNWQTLAERFSMESNVTIRRALMLAIGEYEPPNRANIQRAEWLATVATLYEHDSDAGMHSACEWLLRRWNHPIPQMTADSASIDVVVAGERDWFVNSQGQTFSVVRGPVDAIMGSPDDEPGREPIETVHQIRIGRTFAIAVKEVTVEQYQRFDPAGGDSPTAPLGPKYPACRMNWFDAARYCRWLSEQEGIPEDQMCYPSADLIKEGLTPYPDYLRRTGYRLPSEAELEWSGRAGALTQFCCGQSEELLRHYAWYVHNSEMHTWPPGLLKPNDFGLFDCHGNVLEFGQEWIVHSSAESKSLRSEDVEDVTRVVNVGHYRITRAGSFFKFPQSCRSAGRSKSPPLEVSSGVGIRLARTLASQ